MIYVVVKLGIPDLLADEPKSVDELQPLLVFTHDLFIACYAPWQARAFFIYNAMNLLNIVLVSTMLNIVTDSRDDRHLIFGLNLLSGSAFDIKTKGKRYV